MQLSTQTLFEIWDQSPDRYYLHKIDRHRLLEIDIDESVWLHITVPFTASGFRSLGNKLIAKQGGIHNDFHLESELEWISTDYPVQVFSRDVQNDTMTVEIRTRDDDVVQAFLDNEINDVVDVFSFLDNHIYN